MHFIYEIFNQHECNDAKAFTFCTGVFKVLYFNWGVNALGHGWRWPSLCRLLRHRYLVRGLVRRHTIADKPVAVAAPKVRNK